MHRKPIYRNWVGMINRCENPSNKGYSNYGGRGITVCERWHTFEHFLEDMGPPPEGMWLERIDNDGPYSPNNCKWATPKEQINNRRVTPRFVYKGREYTMTDLVDLSKVSRTTLRARIYNLKWSVEKAVETPTGQYRRNPRQA